MHRKSAPEPSINRIVLKHCKKNLRNINSCISIPKSDVLIHLKLTNKYRFNLLKWWCLKRHTSIKGCAIKNKLNVWIEIKEFRVIANIRNVANFIGWTKMVYHKLHGTKKYTTKTNTTIDLPLYAEPVVNRTPQAYRSNLEMKKK